jgi:hypothetical protein
MDELEETTAHDWVLQVEKVALFFWRKEWGGGGRDRRERERAHLTPLTTHSPFAGQRTLRGGGQDASAIVERHRDSEGVGPQI